MITPRAFPESAAASPDGMITPRAIIESVAGDVTPRRAGPDSLAGDEGSPPRSPADPVESPAQPDASPSAASSVGDDVQRGSAGEPGPEAAAPFEGEGRAIRFSKWGVFHGAPLVTQGIHVGWGGACARHRNAGDGPRAVCKKSMRFCGRSSEETLRRMKAWLLAGALIPECGDARAQHLHRDVTGDVLMSEQELDLALRGLGFDGSSA